MFRGRTNRLAATAFLLAVPLFAEAATVYETQSEFLTRAFDGPPPEPAVAWLSGDLKAGVRQLLGHDYPALRLRYWCEDQRSAWVLEEIGKDLPITVGVVVEQDRIDSLRVLTYRENRGGEVSRPVFSNQFTGRSLDESGTLDRPIDSITGATLSVQALTRIARMALFLDANVGCGHDT